MRKKILAILLCAITAIAFMPTFAFADEGEADAKYLEKESFGYGTYVITVADDNAPLVAGAPEKDINYFGSEFGYIVKGSALSVGELSGSLQNVDSTFEWTVDRGGLIQGDKKINLSIVSGNVIWNKIYEKRASLENGKLKLDGEFIKFADGKFTVAKNESEATIFKIFKKVSDRSWRDEDKNAYKLAVAKDNAEDALNAELNKRGQYRAAEQGSINSAVATAKDAVKAASDIEAVDAAVVAAKASITPLITAAEYNQAAALGKVKIKKAWAGKKKITVKWKKNKKFNAFAIQVAPKGKGWTTVKTVVGAKKTKAKVKGLKKGKTKVRVVGIKYINGKSVPGTPSKSKTRKVR